MTAIMSTVFEQVPGGAFVARHGIDAGQYQALFDELAPQGFRPVVVRGYTDGGAERYVAVFEQGRQGAFVARHGVSGEDYQAVFDELVPQGFRPTVLSGHAVDGVTRYAAVFEQGRPGGFVARHGITGEQYQAVFDEVVPQGFRPTVVSAWVDGSGEERFAAVFEEMPGGFVARHGITGEQYQALFDEVVPQGFRPSVLSGYRVGGEHRFAAVFTQDRAGAFVARHGITAWQYQQLFDQVVPEGFRPTVVDAFEGTGPFEHFTFAPDITADQRGRLLDRHVAGFAARGNGGNLTADEQQRLVQAYGKAVHHTVNTDTKVNASAPVGGASIAVNFDALFPDGDDEIAQTLIHEMMHLAGYSHPKRRDAPEGKSCAEPDPALFDCPGDGGAYYGSPPLRAEFCIAGVQSDVSVAPRMAAVSRSVAGSSCTIAPDGTATMHAT
jgi:hypothetical protein